MACSSLQGYLDSLQTDGPAQRVETLIPAIRNALEKLCSAREREQKLVGQMVTLRAASDEKNRVIEETQRALESYSAKNSELLELLEQQNADLNRTELQLTDVQRLNRRMVLTKYALPVLIGGLAALNQDSTNDALAYGLSAGAVTMLIDDFTGQYAASNIARLTLLVW